MRKKFFALFIALTATLCGCGRENADIHEKIHTEFYDMPSYSAQCEAVVKSNKNQNSYSFTCDYDNTSDTYQICYPDATVTLGDGKARITKGNSINEISATDSDMLILVNTFFASYYESENTSMTVGALSGENSGTTTLECELTKPTKYGKTMKLTIQNKNIIPLELSTIDENGNERIKVIFKSFETK